MCLDYRRQSRGITDLCDPRRQLRMPNYSVYKYMLLSPQQSRLPSGLPLTAFPLDTAQLTRVSGFPKLKDPREGSIASHFIELSGVTAPNSALRMFAFPTILRVLGSTIAPWIYGKMQETKRDDYRYYLPRTSFHGL